MTALSPRPKWRSFALWNEQAFNMTTATFHALQALLVGAVLTLARGAAADAVSCTRTHAAGQRQEKSGYLGDALLSFRQCASDMKCPRPIRTECTERYTAVEARLPTIVFSVVDDHDNDIVDVRVSSASGVIAEGLDGRPVGVDPGSHDLRFELATGQVVTKTVVVRQGEKDRIVSVRVPRPRAETAPKPASAAAFTPESQPDAKERDLSVPVASWVSYLLGGAALGTWGTFALLGRSKEKALADCSPNCPSSMYGDYDTMRRFYLTADVSLGIAGAAVTVGTIVLLSRRRGSASLTDEKPADRRPLSLTPVAVGREGGLFLLRGWY